MPAHGGTHPSAGLQRTPHSCPKTIRGRLLHSPSCACQGPVSFYGDDRCGWLDNASPPVCPLMIPRDLLHPAHNRRLPIASPISFQTTRRDSLAPSWTGASFTPVLAPGRGLAVGRERRTHQAQIPALSPMVASPSCDPQVDGTYSIVDHCRTPIANELHFDHDGPLQT
jgi:hypothetical protein